MKIGIIGFGNIGGFLARNLGGDLLWVADCTEEARMRFSKSGLACGFFKSVPDECGGAKLVVEAASQDAVPLLLPCLKYSDVMMMSIGALANEKLLESLKREAEKYGRKIYLPSGAIGGLDAVGAVCGEIKSATLTTIKPPSSLGRSDTSRTVIFEGNAREACSKFPKNVNVSAALSLAGIGFQRTKVVVVSDPSVKKNTHKVAIESSAGRMEFAFENEPSVENPKTSALACFSALYRIRKIKNAVQIG